MVRITRKILEVGIEVNAQNFQGTQEYVASEQLLSAVNVAIALQKPLLIKGEPGTGKTMLAEAVASPVTSTLTFAVASVPIFTVSGFSISIKE